MYTYLAVLDRHYEGWVSSVESLSPAHTFTAPNDEWALTFILEFIKKERKDCALGQLSRITQGIRLETLSREKVEKILRGVTKKEVVDCSPTQALLEKIEFSHLCLGGTGIREAIEHIQPFDKAKREERLAAKAKFDIAMAEEEKRVAKILLPRVGDDIYVRTSLFVYRGRDDFVGGLAKVTAVTRESNGVHFISIRERPGASYNWEQSLAGEQEELKKKFGKERAHPDPDLRPEFNDPT